MVMDEIKNTKTNGIEQANIDKIIAEQLRSNELKLKDNSFWRYALEQQFFRNEDPMKILDAPQRIKQLSVERTKLLANQYLDGKNLVRIVLLPEKK